MITSCKYGKRETNYSTSVSSHSEGQYRIFGTRVGQILDETGRMIRELLSDF